MKITFWVGDIADLMNDDRLFAAGGRALREFTFNEEPTVSYIETIDECSIVDDSVDDNDDDPNILSDLRDEPTSFHFHELQSTYVKEHCHSTIDRYETSSLLLLLFRLCQ